MVTEFMRNVQEVFISTQRRILNIISPTPCLGHLQNGRTYSSTKAFGTRVTQRYERPSFVEQAPTEKFVFGLCAKKNVNGASFNENGAINSAGTVPDFPFARSTFAAVPGRIHIGKFRAQEAGGFDDEILSGLQHYALADYACRGSLSISELEINGLHAFPWRQGKGYGRAMELL